MKISDKNKEEPLCGKTCSSVEQATSEGGTFVLKTVLGWPYVRDALSVDFLHDHGVGLNGPSIPFQRNNSRVLELLIQEPTQMVIQS